MKTNQVRLNAHQKTVLVILSHSTTPRVAAEELAQTPNLRTAANTLSKLGALTYTDTEASLTDAGRQLSVEENLTDETGTLTTNGQVYLKMFQRLDAKASLTDDTIREGVLVQLLRLDQ